jgi:hypothetical protein
VLLHAVSTAKTATDAMPLAGKVLKGKYLRAFWNLE